MRRVWDSSAVLILVLGLLAVGGAADACTGFLLNRPKIKIMAVNYDWEVPGGRLIVNPRGLQKTALVPPDVDPVSWVSSFGSLTFNQYGQEFPIGGINQMGLAMQVLWLESTVYPTDAPGPSIGALQWVQYCLDNFSTVQQIVDSAQQLAITSRAKLHFLACGQSGSCAVVEFLDGKPAIRAAETLPLPVLANSTYYDSIKALDASLGYGGKMAPPEGDESLSRFVRVTTQLNRSRVENRPAAIDRAFEILADVALEGLNQWRVVYDLIARRVYFTTSDNPERRSLGVGTVELHCALDGVRSIDLSGEGSGDVRAGFSPWEASQNLELVTSSVAKTGFLEGITQDQVLSWGKYPENLRCTLPVPRPTPTPPFGAPKAPIK